MKNTTHDVWEKFGWPKLPAWLEPPTDSEASSTDEALLIPLPHKRRMDREWLAIIEYAPFHAHAEGGGSHSARARRHDREHGSFPANTARFAFLLSYEVGDDHVEIMRCA